MQQASEPEMSQNISGSENVPAHPQPAVNNSEWNPENFCQEKEYSFGTLPCCTPLQGPYSDASWGMGFQFNGNQYPANGCFFLDQSKRPSDMPQSQLLNDVDSPQFIKDFIEGCPTVPSTSNDYRLLNYAQQQNIYNTGFPSQDSLIYPVYNTNSATGYGYCLEGDCLDKMCSPSRSNLSSCLMDQNLDNGHDRNHSILKNGVHGASILSLSNPEDTSDLRVNDSDEDSDIIVEDSDTESEISIDVGPYIEKEVVKAAVMRCFVCNVSFSEHSQTNFVQVNSSYPLTFISQTPVMLKLIEIIPIDMQTSVKFENNLICRRCLNLIDTIENLEVRLVSVKKAICDFVSRSGKDFDDDVSLGNEDNGVSINFDENLSKEITKDTEDKSINSKMVSIGVNTDNVAVVDKERQENTECQEPGLRGAKEPVLPSIDIRLHQCDRCGKMYRRINHLNHHLRKHAGDFSKRCSECGKGFMKSCNLELHMRRHRKHVCTHCRASFTDEAELTEHIRDCRESEFICSECTVLFKSKEKLQAHMEKHNKTPNVCEVCSKTFKHPSGLEAHKKTHSEDKPFSCDKCGLRYKVSSHLRRHQRGHSASFHCTICRAMFLSSAELKNHSLQHTEEIKCDECDKTFANKANLTEHKKIHSGKQTKRECPICKKLITNNFKAHVLSHSEKKPFKCDICNTDFSFKHSMVKHVRNKHKLKKSDF